MPVNLSLVQERRSANIQAYCFWLKHARNSMLLVHYAGVKAKCYQVAIISIYSYYKGVADNKRKPYKIDKTFDEALKKISAAPTPKKKK